MYGPYSFKYKTKNTLNAMCFYRIGKMCKCSLMLYRQIHHICGCPKSFYVFILCQLLVMRVLLCVLCLDVSLCHILCCYSQIELGDLYNIYHSITSTYTIRLSEQILSATLVLLCIPIRNISANFPPSPFANVHVHDIIISNSHMKEIII